MIISVIRTIILYIIIIIAVRIMGKRQISDLQTSELVVTLLLSDVASIPMQNTAQPLLSGFIPMIILVMCEIVISILMMKHTGFRKLICGKPQIVICNGKLDQKQMKRLRMSNEDLMEQLRQLDVFSLSEVEYAIIETNGKMSLMKKPEKNPPSAQVLDIAVPDDEFEVVVISDGDFAPYSAKLCDINKQWVDNTLQENSLLQGDVFLMTVNRQKEYNIILKEN
ncbi:MAG TPA: DUF421 domain-containing protein [Clostridiales bacterium]|nr:DUF421 domain-containing protein [Clostridiales bacterium]